MRHKILAVIFLLIVHGILYSQEYPIPATNAQWNNTIIQTDTQGPTQETSRIEAIGDTIINSIAYSKLFTTWSSNYYQTGQCEFHLFGSSNINRYEGSIRTDESNIVTYIPQGETEAITLYDFSLSIGDSVLISEINNPYYATVLEIDTIIFGDIQRKQLTMMGMFGWYDTWIEGIGSLYGLLTTEHRFWEFRDYELTCYKENNITFYTSNPTCPRCDIATKVNSINYQQNISIYPNPVTERSVIEWPQEFHPKQLIIHDLLGQEIFSKSISKMENTYIDRSDLKVGVLILELVDDDKITHRKQIIIL